jgi:hypothetical protein
MKTNELPADPRSTYASGSDDLRWYSGLALQATIARHGIPETQSAREEFALWAFRMGEEMVRTVHQLERTNANED